MNKFGIGERSPWGDFPKVIRNGDLGELKNEPEYQAAKSGDMPAALELADRLITDDTVKSIKECIGDSKPRILPVLALESAGTNKIPLAMAEVLADRLGLDVELNIVQRDKVGRTDTGADHRLAFNPTFYGNVKKGEKYLIVDDTLAMGGTVASLKGYVENRGGQVVAASVMTAHEGALNLPVKPGMLAAIESKHGPAMNQFWKDTFGYELDKLTQGEAGHLKSAKTVEQIRDRIAKARNGVIERMGQSGAETPQRRTSAERSVLAGSSLLSEAEQLESEQSSMLDSASVEQSYQEMLATYAQAKHDQVERIEDRLENLISQQQARLQQSQLNKPGFLSMPGTKKTWQVSQSQQQSRLQTLQVRLEAVREIKDGMGVHSPRIDELATRKMRAANPELAADWDAMRQAQRHHQALVKKQEQERKQNQERSRSHTLGINKPY
ncbi:MULTISPECIES: phosphoribosyltransferase [Vibrio]|uniref:phosphoribosyltransferase n=1 Tax=Vibrio TaxID=662 RepID=UPI00111EB16F|nr:MULTISPECIES: phosphoribosyltransferase [Vibrio]MDG2676330.1 phosphoribosyltransferase [Vibrio parahaemolyticus]MDW1542461.1 phosphoribosyltransferase [Vibrio sp. YT-17]TOA86326.1 conjugal transfer protein TraN [Vibrio parahaemolyticus]HBH7899511.1 phosphoribosyltransferase [Vibrio parahaemolyticus]